MPAGGIDFRVRQLSVTQQAVTVRRVTTLAGPCRPQSGVCRQARGSTICGIPTPARCIASGCSVKVVQGHLGHKSAATTLDIYSHLWPQDDDRARAAIQTFFGGGVSSVCHDEASG